MTQSTCSVSLYGKSLWTLAELIKGILKFRVGSDSRAMLMQLLVIVNEANILGFVSCWFLGYPLSLHECLFDLVRAWCGPIYLFNLFEPRFLGCLDFGEPHPVFIRVLVFTIRIEIYKEIP